MNTPASLHFTIVEGPDFTRGMPQLSVRKSAMGLFFYDTLGPEVPESRSFSFEDVQSSIIDNKISILEFNLGPNLQTADVATLMQRFRSGPASKANVNILLRFEPALTR
jgi:hypothetical protein